MKVQLFQVEVLLGRRSGNGRCAVPFSGHNSGVRCGRVLAGCQQRQQQRQILRGTSSLCSPGRTQLDGKARWQCNIAGTTWQKVWEPWRGGRPTLQHRLYAPAQRIAGGDSPTCPVTPCPWIVDSTAIRSLAFTWQPCTHFRPAQFLERPHARSWHTHFLLQSGQVSWSQHTAAGEQSPGQALAEGRDLGALWCRSGRLLHSP